MNHEHSSNPEPRDETPSSSPEADEVIRITLQRLDSLEAELEVIDSYLRHGPALAAYLLAEDYALSVGDLEPRFTNAYGGTWESIDHLLRETLDALGWSDKLQELTAQEGIPDNYLVWNRGPLLEHLNQMYQLVHLDEKLHAFHT